MPVDSIDHFVFVDFENVQDINLCLVAGRRVHVTLLFGRNQKSNEMDLTEQIHQQHSQVEIIRAGAAGRNALDLILSHYLGRTVQAHPTAQFHIVSKDKDFDPLVSHLQNSQHNFPLTRVDSFGALPFLARPRKPTVVASKAPVDRRAKLMARLKNPTNPARPATRKALLAHIKTALGKDTSDVKEAGALRDLIKEKILGIDEENKVIYTQQPAARHGAGGRS